MTNDRYHKQIRLGREEYSGHKAYFVTMCAFERRQYFRSDRLARWLLSALEQEAGLHEFLLPAYCLMPDHLHVLAVANLPGCDLLRFVGDFKHKTSFYFLEKSGKTLWQTAFYDHILRSKDAPDAVAWYIWLNPVRAGLVKSSKDYPYVGPISERWSKGEPPEKRWVPPRLRQDVER